jgi:hypothetical protein
MFMLVYKFILASSFAGRRKYVRNFTGVFGAFRQAGLLANGSSARRGYPSKSDNTCKKLISSAFRISKIWLLSSKIHKILTKQRIFLQNVPLMSLDTTEQLLTCTTFLLGVTLI